MNLNKLEDHKVLPLEDIRRKFDKEFEVADDENNEIEEELNIDEIEYNLINNVIPKPEKIW